MRLPESPPTDWRRRAGITIGLLLVAASPLVGLLPGPGGVVVLAVGLGMTLRNSRQARKLYVRFRQRWPRYGRMTERALQTARRKRLKRQLSEKNDPE
jgi:hypothetical protein